MQLSNSFYDICMIYVFKKKEVTLLENKIQIEQALLKRPIYHPKLQNQKTKIAITTELLKEDRL